MTLTWVDVHLGDDVHLGRQVALNRSSGGPLVSSSPDLPVRR